MKIIPGSLSGKTLSLLLKEYLPLAMKQMSFLKKSLTIINEVLFSKEKGLMTLVIHFHGVFKP